jgi:inorganic pyrophosphatase
MAYQEPSFQEKIAAIVGGWEEDSRARPMKVTVGPPPKKNRVKFPFTGTIDFQGLKIMVENKKDSIREGTDASGKHWSRTMHSHYGEIQKTEGLDGDKVDVYVGEDPRADQVFVINQNHPKDHPTKAGELDEQKTMLGFDSAEEAKKLYMSQYDDPSFFRSITSMSIDQFKNSLKECKGEKIAMDGSYAGRSYTEHSLTKQIDQARKSGVRDDKLKQVLREKNLTKPEPANVKFTSEGKRAHVMFEKLSREEAYGAGVEAALRDAGLLKEGAGVMGSLNPGGGIAPMAGKSNPMPNPMPAPRKEPPMKTGPIQLPPQQFSPQRR